MANEFEIWMANPVADGGLRASEEIVNDGDIVTQKHQPVYQMGAHEACAPRYKDAFLPVGWQQFDRRKRGEGGKCDRLGLRIIGRLSTEQGSLHSVFAAVLGGDLVTRS